MNKSRRVRLNGSNLHVSPIWSTVFRHNGIPGENWFQNNNLVVHTCDYVIIIQSKQLCTMSRLGQGKLDIFIISRGPILVKCPSLSNSLSAGSASSDNSDMNTRFNQLCISLVIKVWNVITTVKTYLHFILFFGKWMSLEILTVQKDFDTVCNRSPCTLLMSSCRETPVSSSATSTNPWLLVLFH